MGYLKDTTITCSFHGTQFDLITGKKTGEPKLESPKGMEPLPQDGRNFTKMFTKS